MDHRDEGSRSYVSSKACRRVRSQLNRALDEAAYALACDTEASIHYEQSTGGLSHRLWQSKVWCTAFLGALAISFVS